MIPKILIQSTRNNIPDYVQNMIKKQLSDEWEHRIFNDKQSIQFFKDNPLDEFPNIIDVFNSFTGAHKSDLFRYYFTYINGGVFIDDDAMVYIPLDEIINGCNAFFVTAFQHRDNHLFNGFYGVEPGNTIIYECLKHAYKTKPHKLSTGDKDPKKYLYFTRVGYIIYNKYKSQYKIKEFVDICKPDMLYSYIEGNGIFFKHFYINKQIFE